MALRMTVVLDGTIQHRENHQCQLLLFVMWWNQGRLN